MPIRPELRPLYPPRWREPSARVRFARAGGRWWDEAARTWGAAAVAADRTWWS